MKKVIAGNEVTTFRNKRNENKYIQRKKYDDGHTYARQYMEWDTPEGVVHNPMGTKKGGYHRFAQTRLNDVLDDYDEVEECNNVYGSAINDMYANSYETAIGNVIKELNKRLKLNLTYKDNFHEVQMLVESLGITFDENGEIVK